MIKTVPKKLLINILPNAIEGSHTNSKAEPAKSQISKKKNAAICLPDVMFPLVHIIFFDFLISKTERITLQ